MNEHLDLADQAIRAESWTEAEEHLRKGLAQQPDALAYGRLAYCLSKQGRDKDALAAADAGLRLDRSLGSLKNLRDALAAHLDHAHPAELATAPGPAGEDLPADELAERGWVELINRRPAQALDLFRSALILDRWEPAARVGMVSALKDRYLFLRLLLGGLQLFQQLARYNLLVFLALIFFRTRLLRWAAAHPDLAIWATVLIYGGWAFVVLTWIAQPLMNLMLRLNRYGWYALTPGQVAASNWMGICLFLAIGCLVWALVGGGVVGLIGAAVCGLLMVPAATVFRARRGWPRWLLALFTSALAAAGVGGVILLMMAQDPKAGNPRELMIGGIRCLGGYVIGLFLHGFLADFLILSGDRHRD